MGGHGEQYAGRWCGHFNIVIISGGREEAVKREEQGIIKSDCATNFLNVKFAHLLLNKN